MPVFTDSLFIHFDKRNRFVLKIEFKKEHFFPTARTLDGVISKRKKYIVTPCNHVKIDGSLLSGDGTVQPFIFLTVSGINTIVSDHLEVLFRDMANQSLDELHGRNFFDNEFFIFMPVVMEGDIVAVIMVDTFCGDNRSAKITTDIFNNIRGITLIVLCINIKAVDMILINVRFNRFE